MKKTFFLLLVLAAISNFAYSQTVSDDNINGDPNRERKKNLTVREYNTDAKGGKKWLDHITVYNKDGYKIEEIEYAVYGMRQRTTYEYDAQYHCIKEMVYDDRNKLVRIKKYEYNADGTKKIQYNYLPNGKLYSTKVYEYTTNK